MNTNKKRARRIFTDSEKMKAVQRIIDGETKASVSRDIHVPESTLRGWCKNEDKLRRISSKLSSALIDQVNDENQPAKRLRTEFPMKPESLIPNDVKQRDSSIAKPLELMDLTTKSNHQSPLLLEQNQLGSGANISMNASSPFSIPYQPVNELNHGLNETWMRSFLSHPYGLFSLLAVPNKKLYPGQSLSPVKYETINSTIPSNLNITSTTVNGQVTRNCIKTSTATTPLENKQESSQAQKKKPHEKSPNSNPKDIDDKDSSEYTETIDSTKQLSNEPKPKPRNCRNQAKVSNFWDKLLLQKTYLNVKEPMSNGIANGESDADTVEALKNAEKFLAWLETSGDPMVTQIHVYQLRGLLNCLRSRRTAVEPSGSTDAARKH